MLSTREGAASDARRAAADARRILVIRLGSLGDVVRTRFAFAGLRELCPEARIDWLVDDRCAAGLVGLAGLGEILTVPRRALTPGRPGGSLRALRGVLGTLRAHRYDLSVDFHCVARSALAPAAARIPARVGYGPGVAREGSWRLLTHRVPLPEPHVSRFERNAALVRYLGGEVPSRPPPLDLPQDAGAGLGELPREFMVVHPGTSPKTIYKRWAAARYAEVARSVYEASGIASLVTWGPVPGERERAEQVVRLAGAGARLAPETPGIDALLALLSRAKLFVGGDSGPMHLATLAGRPVVVVFGPTDPTENAPFSGLPSRVVRRDVGCNPCREGCPARTCLGAVESAAVAQAALALIAAETGAA